VRYYRDHPPSPAKVGYLESVRGLACLLVVSTHFCNIFLPTDNPAVMESQHPWGFATLHREIPLVRLLTAGGYAVDVFFVLSGFVLSLPFLGRRTDINRRVPEAIARRPVRLYGLVMAVMVICQLAFSSGHAYGGYFAPAKPWPSFLLDVANPYTTAVAYTVVFWTIRYELWGAFGVYAFMWALGGTRYRWLAYGIIFYLLKGEYYQGFLFGVFLADIWHMCRMREPSAWVRRSAPLVLMLGLLLGSFAVQPDGRGTYDAWLTSWLPDVQGWVGGGYVMIGAALTLASVLMSPAMQRWLSHAWLVALGRISFSIYAIHALILITIVCWLFNTLHPGAAVTRLYFQPDGASYALLAAALMLLVYLPLSFAAAAWLTAAVDEPCVRLSHKFGRWIMRRSPAPSVPEQKEPVVPVS
jgi:peptidoglycan/LPS O-acetylase OafA/YrhL